MYPTISHFLQDVFGWNIPLPIQSYGFFVALAFMVNIYILLHEFKRKEKEGLLTKLSRKITKGNALSITQWVFSGFVLGFIIGYKGLDAVLQYGKFVDNPQAFILSLKGNIFGGIIGGAISMYMLYRENKAERTEYPKPKLITTEVHPYELLGNMLLLAAATGVLGAKIFHNLENLDQLIADPIHSLISFSGLSFLGGLIVAGIALVWYGKRNGIPAFHLADTVAPSLALGYGVGRMGCQVSGDGCWGINNPNPKPDWLSWAPDWLWSYNYPNNVINAGDLIQDCSGKYCHALGTPVFPTPIYETLMMLLVFAILWSIRKHIKVPGVLFTIYIAFAGLERLLIEQIRINNELFGVHITQAEIIASLMIVFGIGASLYLYLNRKKNLLY
ncbi:MAG TPA: diacylglyceryl transferase [Bacteroidales bacterium]|nr:diacylglyceryl transferase [Bacteroidales bacterium]